MRSILTILCFCLFALPAAFSGNGATPSGDSPLLFDAEAVMGRVKAMTNEAVKPQYNGVVQGYIKTYVLKIRPKSEEILGLSAVYFPLFEAYLAEYGFPLDLRYLPVVESALNARAVSRAGAVGLWQFMPETGREMGLRIDEFVDERRDPNKSTQAAMRYLQRLYKRFGRWELALAAYNSGPGRVNRAIKRGRSRDFWRIRRYLPRETRNYVPAFIAATYLLKHYDEHDLLPAHPPLDQQITETILVHESYSFYELAQVTGLPLNVIATLNPAYTQDFIPADRRGHYLTLPRRVVPAFQEYAEMRSSNPQLRQDLEGIRVLAYNSDHLSDQRYYQASFYEVQPNETLPELAARLRCTPYQLRAWNQLKSDLLQPGRRLLFYEPYEERHFARTNDMGEFSLLSSKPLPSRLASGVPASADPLAGQKRIFYYVKRGGRMSDLVDRLPGTTLSDLILLNDHRTNGGKLQRGTYICIREF